MGLLSRLSVSHRIDDWVSDQTLIAARTLNQVSADLMTAIDADLARARLAEGLFAPGAFVTRHVAPRVREVAEPVAMAIVEEANMALRELVEAEAVWVRGGEHHELPDRPLDGVGDIASAAVPLAAGAAALASLPFAAVTTTTAWFGLVAVTTVSWPVVVGGSALAGLGLATGALNAGKIRDKTQARLRQRSHDYIGTALLKGTAKAPSILQQLAAEFECAGERAKGQFWL